MKKYFLFILLSVIFLSGCSEVTSYSSVKINDKKINVEIADTPDEQYQGLSGRKGLCEKCGMLFVFSNKEKPSFVMRDMNFGLDIIWVSDNKIVQINKNLSPVGEGSEKSYEPTEAVDYVLEVNAGFCDKNDIKKGDLFIF